MEDTFRTLSQSSDAMLYKEKNSKFFAQAFPMETVDELKPILENLKKTHPGAGHFCFAFRLGTDPYYERANDDGEPGNSAGAPILGQIHSFGLTNILVVVVRFFGGVKLGVGGLISAYRTSAQMALESSVVEERIVMCEFLLFFDYQLLTKVMRVIREKQLSIESQKMETFCELKIAVRKKDAPRIEDNFSHLKGLKIIPIAIAES